MVGWLSYRCCLGRRRAPRRAFAPLRLKTLALCEYEACVCRWLWKEGHKEDVVHKKLLAMRSSIGM